MRAGRVLRPCIHVKRKGRPGYLSEETKQDPYQWRKEEKKFEVSYACEEGEVLPSSPERGRGKCGENPQFLPQNEEKRNRSKALVKYNTPSLKKGYATIEKRKEKKKGTGRLGLRSQKKEKSLTSSAEQRNEDVQFAGGGEEKKCGAWRPSSSRRGGEGEK